MTTADPARWFARWLAHHQGAFPSVPWVGLDDPASADLYGPMLEVLIAAGASYDLAGAATVRMVRRPDLHADASRHAAALREVLGQLRDTARAARDSRDCPECRGTGYARRRYVEPALMRWRPYVPLYCRCTLGRALVERDRRADFPPVECDDLQARPELWDLRLDHWTWSDRPAEADRLPLVRPGDPECWYEVPEDAGAQKKPGPRDARQSPPGAGRKPRIPFGSNCTGGKPS